MKNYTAANDEGLASPNTQTSATTDSPSSLAHKHVQDSFVTGLCKCGGPCVEAYFCHWCQISRQYNVLFNETKGIHWGVCCGLAFADLCVLSLSGKICQCYLRSRLRTRYNMKDACCADFCTVWCCACCALSQTHWEMAMRGDDPGATCSCGEADVVAQMR